MAMMVTLGNDSSSADLSYVFEAFGIGGDEDPCSDTRNWSLSLDPTTGKCYSVCAAGNQAIEVDPKECRSIIPQRPASTSTGTGGQTPQQVNWMTQKTIISGLPNWAVVVGGAALAAVVLNN